MSIRGIDVSDYNGSINWQNVARDGITFAFIKATEGRSLVASSFNTNWKAAKDAGIVRGAYHFFLPDRTPQEQADIFLQTVKLEPGDLPPVLDIEVMRGLDAGKVIDGMIKWLDIIEQKTGILAIIYTYPGFWDSLGSKGFTAHPLWIAHYTNAEQPIIPGGWRDWVFWQFTDQGKVNGITGVADVNIFYSIQLGNQGEKVRAIQSRLSQKGFYSGEVDGNFGQQTLTAVMNFQKAQGLVNDGIVGMKTWGYLMGLSNQVIPTPIPTPTPVNQDAISLIDVCLNYRNELPQQQALTWLQSKISLAIMLEFTRRYRNQTLKPITPMSLIDVCRTYRGLSYQNQALDWLQIQAKFLLTEFAKKWRNRTVAGVTPVALIDVGKYYRGLPHQKQALDWLQSQINQKIMADFSQRWRNIPSTTLAPVRLTDVGTYYRDLPHQKESLIWLEKQILPALLTEFSSRWRNG
jgi:lysozyme